jgi:hypothetical protein
MKREALLAAVLVLAACDTTPRWPDAADGWKQYRNDHIGIALEYPAGCTVDADGDRVLIRYDGGPIISIAWLTEESARRNGLWPRHDPVGPVQLGGRTGRLYRYKHYDGPFGMRTTAFVVPHHDRYFALEFRTARDELGPLERYVLASFAFTDTGGTGP